MRDIILVLLGAAVIALCMMVWLQQATIDTMLDNSAAALAFDKAMQSQVMENVRRIDELTNGVNMLERQGDIITAATRSSWADAYKLIHEGVFE